MMDEDGLRRDSLREGLKAKSAPFGWSQAHWLQVLDWDGLVALDRYRACSGDFVLV